MGRPPGADGQRTREEILECALGAFAESGFEAMSVRRLTRELDVSHNLVHHYFDSKTALWEAALDHGLAKTLHELSSLLEDNVGGPDPVATVRVGVERAILLLARNPAVVRIVLDESARGGERLDFIYARFLAPGMDVLKRFLANARGKGLRDVDARVLLLFTLSAASTFFTQAALAEKLGISPPASGRALNRHARALVELILGGVVEPV